MRWVIILMLLFSFLHSQTARVKYLIGEVKFKSSPTVESWAPLKLNSKVKQGNIIRTGPESICEIEYPDGSRSKILANSLLEIRKMPAPDKEDGELFANLGRFFFSFTKRLVGKVKVGSPVAVAAIRGTEFLLTNEPLQSAIWVKEGVVEFGDKNFANTVQVKALQKSVIAMGKKPSLPVPLTQEEISELETLSRPAAPPQEKEEPIKKAQTPVKPPEQKAEIQPTPPKPEIKPPAQEQKPAQPVKTKPPKTGLRTGLTLGAVTIDDQIYNQIGLRPEFSIGKLGVALDLSLYIDQNGNIRKENWDSFKDVIEKIYYVRWAHRGDPFYLKIGAIDNYRLGFGLLMNHYSNTVEYPSVIRTGMELGIKTSDYGFDAMVNNFSEVFSGGGLFAGRLSYRPIGKLEVGASVVFDRNQYKGLKDRDNDGIPDMLDDFPDKKTYALDSDNDGIPDRLDFDRDGDGFTDNKELLIERFGPEGANLYNEQDSVLLKPEPFNINKAKDKTQLAFALDVSYPILNYKYLQLITYGQYAKYPYNGAWGVTAPGFLAKFAFINAFAEYRVFGRGFLPEYFNTTYELERATYKTVSDTGATIIPFTKRQYVDDYVTERLKGYVVGADFNLFDFMIFGAEYQNMSKANLRFRTFRANLDVNTRFIPKISRAGAYYYQNNARKLFKKTEGTILGYRIEYEISPSAALLLDFRQTYRDVNGDGKISGSNETVKTTNIQTVLRF
ncbi:MAG: hypothetical protein GXO77_00890 [Calditrichaeota bacterium]|nr:hypothetical protein [Calditrichota bacterium]